MQRRQRWLLSFGLQARGPREEGIEDLGEGRIAQGDLGGACPSS